MEKQLNGRDKIISEFKESEDMEKRQNTFIKFLTKSIILGKEKEDKKNEK